jgi:hypothetical protein
MNLRLQTPAAESHMYLFEMLYLQDLVDGKLHKESHLRNLVAHMALSKRLHEVQMEYDMEDCVLAGKKSEYFAEFCTRTQTGTNMSTSTASTSHFCEQYGAMTLYYHGDNKETP